MKCLCGCGKEIVVKPYHKWYGIPKFISGHNNKDKKFGKRSKEQRFRISEGTKKVMSNPTMRSKLSLLKGGTGIPGENSEYNIEWNHNFKERIRCRDNNTCQICNIHSDFLESFHKRLDVHHVDYNKKNSIDENLISLCHGCHSKTNNNHKYWKEYFRNKIASMILV